MDNCIYIRDDILLKIYVDDINIVDSIKDKCNIIFLELFKYLKIQDKDLIKNFLDLNIIHNWSQYLIVINQDEYIDRLITEFGLINVKMMDISLHPSLSLISIISNDKICNILYYQKLAQFNSNLTFIYLKVTLYILRYLKGIHNLCIIYRKQDHSIAIIGYSDMDWESDPSDRKSYTEYIFIVNDSLVTWTSHKQMIITLSSMETEYMTLSDAARETITRLQFFQELEISSTSILILFDNETIIDLANRTIINHHKIKYIDIRYHIIYHYL